MRAADQLQLPSLGEKWTGEFGGAGGRSARLPCSAAWVSSGEKRGWRLDKWLIMKTLVPKLKL